MIGFSHRTTEMEKVEEENIKWLLCLIFFLTYVHDSSLITEENKIT